MLNLTEEQKEKLGIIEDERVDFYFKVENAVIDDEIFSSASEALLFIVLSRYCNNKNYAFPSLNTLAKKCYCSRPTVIKTLNSLIEKGVIKKIPRTAKNGAHESNLYSICNIKKYTKSEKIVEKIDAPSKGDLPPLVNEVDYPSKAPLPKEELIIKNNIKKNKKIDDDKKESINPQNLDLEKVKFKENLNIYISKVGEVIGKNREEISRVINTHLMKTIDMDLLLKKISESKFLSGKLEDKPVINNFCSKNMIDKILIGFYDDREEKSKEKFYKEPSKTAFTKEDYAKGWW